MAKRKKPSTATKKTKSGVPPEKIMRSNTTAVMAMLDIMMLRGPTLSDMAPATGAAMKPASCRPIMAEPTAQGS